jgi:hypothetical protein
VIDDLISVFNDAEKSKQKCKFLAVDYELALELEKKSVSDLSPDIVKDDEGVARQIFSPIHINDKGDITPAAFDDVLNKGLSVNRRSYISTEGIHLSGESKAEADRQRRPDREYLGFISVSVEQIRACLIEDKRIFAVYDSALTQAKHHADICAIILGSTSDLPRKSANMYKKRILQKIFSGLIQP